MTRKVIGGVLLVVGGSLIIILLAHGGPFFPHIIGPVVVAVIGIMLFAIKKKAG
jgi:hypothetical protein